MLLPSNLLGILFALMSALVWGAGDFSGGFATRRGNLFQVLAISALSGIAILVVFALLWRETLPSLASMGWALLGGVTGAIGMASLYRGLSLGNAASVAPTSAVIGVALPVGFSFFTNGLPATGRLAGFGLALLGIWLVSQAATGEGKGSRTGFLLACLAGVGFGGFFIFIAQVEPGKMFIPLIVARSVTFCMALVLLRANHMPLPSPAAFTANPVALLAGVLDAGGNIFYLLARQFARLDVAAVLSSLYPATTVLLASLLLKEKVSRTQGAGVVLCLAAIALITI